MKPDLRESESGPKQFGWETETAKTASPVAKKKKKKAFLCFLVWWTQPRAGGWGLLTVIFSQGPLWGFANQTNGAGLWSDTGEYRWLLRIGLWPTHKCYQAIRHQPFLGKSQRRGVKGKVLLKQQGLSMNFHIESCHKCQTGEQPHTLFVQSSALVQWSESG